MLPRLLAVLSVVAVLAVHVPESAHAQDKTPKGQNDPADPVPADGEFTKFGIYEKTAPRPAAAKAVETTLPLELRKGDRIALIGNTLFERAQEFGHFEAMLQKRYPEKNLTVRNLAWSADEIGLQPRPANFADTEQHLTHEKAAGIEHPAQTPTIPIRSSTGAANSGAVVEVDPLAAFVASLPEEQRTKLVALLHAGNNGR